jgi:pSer/pThr/pTyr-binding forkhead associated (FHA) protein
MAVRLTVSMKGAAGAAAKVETVTLEDDTFVLGRDPTCRVVLAQQAVSRSHARISRDGGLFFVEDLGSSFGTQVNGRALPRGEKRLLQSGDLIAIANFDVTFASVSELEDDAAAPSGFHAKRAVKKVMRTLAQGSANAYFRVMNGPTEGQHIEFSEGQEYIFGRDEAAADVVLGDDLVSRRHAKLRRDWSGVHLEDLQSRNGVKVNRKRIQRSTLKDRDEVEIGGVRFLFIDPSEVREVSVPAGVPEGEATLGQPTQAPSAAKPPPPPEPARPAVVTEEAPPEEVAESKPAEAAPEPAVEAPLDEGGEHSAVAEPPSGEEIGEAPRNVLDLSNRQTQIALAVGAAFFLIGLLVLILLVSGAFG